MISKEVKDDSSKRQEIEAFFDSEVIINDKLTELHTDGSCSYRINFQFTL